MVGTYIYDGKKVSESEFNKKVYGSDSRQYEAARKREEQKKQEIASAGSKGSRYTKTTRRDGSVEIADLSGKVVETKTAEQAAAESKKTIVVGVGKNKDGSTRVENVGQYLTEKQRQEVSKLTSEKGRLSTSVSSQNVQVQGRDAVQTTVNFSYRDQQKSVGAKSVDVNAPPAYATKLAQEQFAKNPLAQKITIGDYTFTRTGKTASKEVPEYIGSNGVISAAEKPKGLYNKLSLAEDKLVQKAEKKSYKNEASFVEGGLLFGIGVAKGVIGVGKLAVGLGSAVIHPKRSALKIYGAGKAVVQNPRLIYQAPLNVIKGAGTSFTQNPSGFIGEVVGSAGVVKVVGVAAKAGYAKFKSPKVVSETTGTTHRIDFADDISQSTSQSSTKIKSGSKTYDVGAVTRTVDKADDASARLQSSKTDLTIKELGKKGDVKSSTTGYARAEVVASKADDGTVLARGDTVQSTTVGKKSFVRQGDLAAIGSSSDDATRLTTVVKTGKASKQGLISSADDLNFVDDASKKVTSIESSSSKKILEFTAPQKQSVSTPFGSVEYTSKQSFKNTLYDDFANARAGSYLSKADKNLNIKIDPYSRTTTQNGIGISYTGFADDVVSKAPFKPAVSPDAKALIAFKDNNVLSLTQTDQGFVVSVRKVASTAPSVVSQPSSTLSLTAVQDLEKVNVQKTAATIDKATTATASGVASTIQAAQEAPLKPIQYNTVKGATPVSVTKRETLNKAILQTKSFTSTKVLPVQKLSPAAVLDVRTKSKSKTALATKTFTDSVVAQSTSQQQALVQVTAQKSAVRSRVAFNPQVVAQTIAIPRFPSSPKKTSLQSGFDVYVRERGVFKRASSSALTRRDALDFGAFTVSNTARATFDIRPSSNKVGEISSKVRGSFGNFASNFIQKNGLFIEKREKRIKSLGEKAEITAKGLFAARSKKRGLF